MRDIRELDMGLYCPTDLFQWGRSLTEMAHADVVDFISIISDLLDQLLDLIQPLFEIRRLFINKAKTERVTINQKDTARRVTRSLVLDLMLMKTSHTASTRRTWSSAQCGNYGTSPLRQST